MNKVLLLLIASVQLFSQDDPFEILKKSKWISDGDSTRKWIERNRPDKAKNETLMGLFGKMKCLYTDNEFISEIDGQVNKMAIRLIGTTQREVVFITKDDLECREVPIVVRFTEDFKSFSIYNDLFEIREKFIADPKHEKSAQQIDSSEPASPAR